MTRTRHRPAGTTWRCVLLALILCLRAAPLFAQVPQAIIDRFVELNVQESEARYLNHSGQIDNATWGARGGAIDAERGTLNQQFRQYSPDEQRQAQSQIDGLTKARLATLEPQWDAKAAAFKQQQKQHDREIMDAIAVDARAALEPQRQRLLLQQRRDRGEITADDFAAEDKKALDQIMALRGKYVADGEFYANRFDLALTLLTQAIAKNPAVSLPVPQTSTAPGRQGGTSPTDYQHDVGIAADALRKWNDVRNRYWIKKDIDVETMRESQKIYSADLARLNDKWRAAGRGAAFERDYQQRVAGNTAPAKSAARGSGSPAVKPGFSLFNGVGIVIGIVVVIGGLYLIGLLSRKPPAPARGTSDVYGTAHYAPVQLDVLDDTCLAKGLFFGKSSAPQLVRLPLDAPGAPVCSTPEHHTLIVARTRTGKGTRVIVPTLLRYAGSAFVIDPKGENAAVTARVRRDVLQQKICVLNPWNELGETFASRRLPAATYNPLDILDRHDPNVVAVAQTLAGAICPAPSDAKDRFWQGSAANVLTAVFLWLADREGMRDPALPDEPPERKTLARAREIVSLSRKDFTQKYLVPMSASDAFSGAIREMAAPFIDLAPETYSGIMSNLSESTKFLSDPQIKAATATSSFSMHELATQKMTVYVVIPTERMDAQKTWLRLVVASAMHSFKRPHKRGESRHRCLFLIDEFAALGRLDDMPRDIATMGGFGVDFALVVQGLDQLKDHYHDASATILSNCAYKWFCNVNDLDSAKYLSETLGKKTVVTESTSESTSSSSGGTGGGTSSSSHSTSRSETARSLLNPDEILNLGKGVAITLQPHGHPQYVRPVDYWNLPGAFG